MLGDKEDADERWEAERGLKLPKISLAVDFASCGLGRLNAGGALFALFAANREPSGRGRGGDLVGEVEGPE